MTTKEYKFQIAQCDVPATRRPTLEAFRAKRAAWLAWIDTDEHHAIWTVISSMVWSDVSFRTLTKFAIDDDDDTCLSNSLIAEQLINGHIATQVLAIRRLMDNTGGVMSLRGLIKDIQGNFDLFTRENYVCHDGLPYDYEAVQLKEMTERIGSGSFWAATTGPQAHATSRMVHEQFDRLAGITPANRSRQDRLPIALIETIAGWLDGSGADDLAKWSHVYLAHAGKPEKREQIAGLMVTTDKITDAIKTLSRVTEAVSAEIMFASGRLNSLMPTAQFDQFENLEKSIIRTDGKEKARQVWDTLSDERDRYLEGVRESLLSAAKLTRAP